MAGIVQCRQGCDIYRMSTAAEGVNTFRLPSLTPSGIFGVLAFGLDSRFVWEMEP